MVQPYIPESSVPQASADHCTLKERLAGTCIHPDSFLATDYLNQFNGIAMLLEMAHEMPDMLDEAADWTPKSYVEHFAASRLSDKDLAIAAYGAAPAAYRRRFDRLVARLDALVLETIAQALAARDAGTALALEAPLLQIHELLRRLNGVIHGRIEALEQDGIDAALEPTGPAPHCGGSSD